MKRNWLNITEYLLLIGTGVGSVAAAIAIQPLLFTAAPMSALLLLNLINRRRGDAATREEAATSAVQLDQKFSTDIAALQQQVQVLPNFLDLASLRKSVLAKSEENLEKLTQEINQIKREITKPEWRLLRQEMRQLQEQYASVADTLGGITNQLHRMSAANRVDGLEDAIAQLKSELSQLRVNLQNLSNEQKLNSNRVLQEQIDHLNRRLNKLPTPFDASSLKQDVDSLVKMMGDMVSRHELAKITAQVEKLSQQSESFEQSLTPLKVATAILKKQLDTLTTKVNVGEQVSDKLLENSILQPQASLLENLRATVAGLEQRLNQLPVNADLSILRNEMQGIVSNQLGPLQQQLTAVQQLTQSIDRQQKTLREWVNRLPQVLDTTALQNEVKYLAARVEWAENSALDVQAQVEATIKSQLGDVTQQLQANQPGSQYELIFDVKGGGATQGFSRTVLEEALDKAQARLIVVYPFPTPETLNSTIIQKFQAFLNRKGCLDIGWGHLGDVTSQHFPRSIDRRRSLEVQEKGFLYDTLNQLTQLKRQYPDQFRFKVLGTSENFLVCDRSFAILGAQSVATASVVFPQAAVGLRTNDPEVIQGLVGRFDDPVLDPNDATAYFNRAATRYDLGDRAGAIADYTEVLRIHPSDSIAYNNRGLARYDLGDRQGAIEDFTSAVQHDSQNYVAYCNRGFLRSEMGDKLGAIEDYTRAIQANPDYSTAYFYRGLARTRMQNKLGAIQDYTEVIRLNPQDATAYFYRGLASIKLGHHLDATKDLRQAAQLFSDQGDTANYQQTLRTLKKLHKTLVIAGANEPVANGA
ncbi:tetratricopeptide repeat protein [Leptothermofonsia sp. ETS-13]|uniref:tetratricopeptide repeat protein n=1 Tax=Leptothermofonsia sp. ETS-13 TaxID=3035696 RepID=UPI003B9FE719